MPHYALNEFDDIEYKYEIHVGTDGDVLAGIHEHHVRGCIEVCNEMEHTSLDMELSMHHIDALYHEKRGTTTAAPDLFVGNWLTLDLPKIERIGTSTVMNWSETRGHGASGSCVDSPVDFSAWYMDYRLDTPCLSPFLAPIGAIK